MITPSTPGPVWLRYDESDRDSTFWYICPAGCPKTILEQDLSHKYLITLLLHAGFERIPTHETPADLGEVWIKRTPGDKLPVKKKMVD